MIVGTYTLVTNDQGDWIGIYGPDGRLIAEGHSFESSELLKHVGIAHNHISDVDLDEIGHLPPTLGEVASLGGTEQEIRP